jgi:hypothetical protein
VRNRLLLPASALFVVLLGSYGILAAGKGLSPLPALSDGVRRLPLARCRLENVHLRAYEGTRQTVDARVSSLEVAPGRAGLFTLPALRQARMRDLDATLVDAAGRPTRVRAARAKADPLHRGWILEGNASVEGPDAHVACAKLRWHPILGFLPSPRCPGGVSHPQASVRPDPLVPLAGQPPLNAPPAYPPARATGEIGQP